MLGKYLANGKISSGKHIKFTKLQEKRPFCPSTERCPCNGFVLSDDIICASKFLKKEEISKEAVADLEAETAAFIDSFKNNPDEDMSGLIKEASLVFEELEKSGVKKYHL